MKRSLSRWGLTRAALSALTVVASLLALAAPADGAFPGRNGKIAFTEFSDNSVHVMNPDGTQDTGLGPGYEPAWSANGAQIAFVYGDIYKMNADGSGRIQLTLSQNLKDDPTWSPDGRKIAFQMYAGTGGNSGIVVMNSDGGSPAFATHNRDFDPAWSPDGTKIAFSSQRDGNPEIYVMNADGSGQTRLTTDPADGYIRYDTDPTWSPDGGKIAWGRNTFDPELCVCFLGSGVYVMNANGSGQTSIISGQEPAWSPDGQKIVFRDRITTGDECPPAGFAQCRISVMNPDGSGRQTIRNGGGEPDWQPLNYPAPKRASRLQFSLVPKFKQCDASRPLGAGPANATHAPPLSVPACEPPEPSAGVARVGPLMRGRASFVVLPGDEDAANGDNADVAVAVTMTDIRAGSASGVDYDPNAGPAPDLTARVSIQVTDFLNTASAPNACDDPSVPTGRCPGTAGQFDFAIPIACAPNSDPARGSTCNAATRADTVLPGMTVEGGRQNIAFSRMIVRDVGDDTVAGNGGDSLFAQQGIFVP